MNTRQRMPVAADANIIDGEILRLLSQRFGDGLVYCTEEKDHDLLRKALEEGLVSRDGRVTAAGLRMLRRDSVE